MSEKIFLTVFMVLHFSRNGENQMDKKKSILNVSVSVSFKIITMVMVIVVKRLLIQTCGNEVNGLNALYLSIVGFLAVAELGVGSAITFCMYKPIVDGDEEKVAALYRLFHRLYCAIGIIITLIGIGISPFICYLAVDYALLDVNLQLTFVLMLLSVVLSYFFGSKTALINAYKNNYITSAITSGGIILQYILQIVVLLYTKSFSVYLVCRTLAVLVQWCVTEIVARKKHASILTRSARIDCETKKELSKNIKAMFMHKIGYVLVNTVDSVIISMFVGVIALGEYSNYTTILASLTGVINLVFTSLTSIVGHLYVEKSNDTARKYCETLHLLNFAIGVIFYLGYYAIIDDLIAIMFGANLIVDRSIAFVITINGFVQFMRSCINVFRDATGTFYYDRWKPLAEGVANIVMSILLVKWIGVAGVIVATIITNLVICHVIEPYVLYKNAFSVNPTKYYLKNYSMIVLFVGMLLLMQCCMCSFSSYWSELLVNGCISVGISAVVCGIMVLWNRKLKDQLKMMIKRK